MDYAEIVDADVRELRASCDLADRPDAGRGGLQPFVNSDDADGNLWISSAAEEAL